MLIDYLLSIILGILSSLVASIVFLLLLSTLRPNIEISESIAQGKDALDASMYSIKVINRGRRSVMNVKAQLQLIEPTNAPNGTIEEASDIPLEGTDPLELAAFSRKDDTEGYACRFSTLEDMDKCWADDKHAYLRFRIFATDSLSGLGRVFTQKYRLKRIALRNGSFVKGHELTIV